MLFQKVLCENWMFELLENDFLWFNSFIFYICYYVDVKKGKHEVSFKFSIGPSHPISEIIAHVCRLKGLETWLIKNQVFFQSREWGCNVIYSGCQVVEWLLWVRRSRNIPKIGPNHSHFMVYIYEVYLKINCVDRLRLVDDQYEIMFFDMM